MSDQPGVYDQERQEYPPPFPESDDPMIQPSDEPSEENDQGEDPDTMTDDET
jgi:hypothetical protein